MEVWGQVDSNVKSLYLWCELQNCRSGSENENKPSKGIRTILNKLSKRVCVRLRVCVRGGGQAEEEEEGETREKEEEKQEEEGKLV